ncbi:DNA endonuclease SmrA [Atlantibacter sp.]|uniref:DNA endonuclease SmrA n=1 Tax=Atlantibacter sp. TaxID=1903473 RepID=UPI0028A28E72|nr:DNA endonuclease SmrA [Atlantibacter sp.]
MKPDDKSLFLEAMDEVKPLKNAACITWQKPKSSRVVAPVDLLQLDNFLTTGYLDVVPLATPLEFKREGVQIGVLDKLRQGKYPQQATLNLLRLPIEQCRQRLFAFMHLARQQGLRNVLIVHGKGREDNAHANIVRSYLARWLAEFDDVQAFSVALPHHGGSGACYVALKKSDAQRLDNWERHAKRSR